MCILLRDTLKRRGISWKLLEKQESRHRWEKGDLRDSLAGNNPLPFSAVWRAVTCVHAIGEQHYIQTVAKHTTGMLDLQLESILVVVFQLFVWCKSSSICRRSPSNGISLDTPFVRALSTKNYIKPKPLIKKKKPKSTVNQCLSLIFSFKKDKCHWSKIIRAFFLSCSLQ